MIPRIAASHTFYGLAVLRQFEMMGVYPLNESVAIGRSRGQAEVIADLARDGVDCLSRPLPTRRRVPTMCLKSLEEHGRHQAARGHARDRRGAGGNAEIGEVGHRCVPWRRIKHPGAGVHQGGGGVRTCASWSSGGGSCGDDRTGNKDDFRSNLHRGGKAERVEISAEERKLALKAAKSMGLNVAGVDMLRAKRGPCGRGQFLAGARRHRAGERGGCGGRHSSGFSKSTPSRTRPRRAEKADSRHDRAATATANRPLPRRNRQLPANEPARDPMLA